MQLKKSPNDLSMTIRDFIVTFNEYKLIDGKILSTRDIVEVFASDNSIVYDSDNAYNLELEVWFFLYK